ncbi:MAG: 2-amino-4-hydroxy-6-hydroxymethyldihydropteridine diphosphokinase [Candidimonas sp.]|nr:MAG: 2-amino-4-hydroxy-6-hydroxymethyldihydropteridine diphosphokinase [Candidimonas sp.]TAM20772.1 MAG: 2-amino-4-hydroxy-6-hydroxymethyldihydropteridine diphosphokinase [Candidimonas sp.]
MILAYIGLGANLGDARATVLQAASDLAQTPGIDQLKLSNLYRTAPVDAGGPHYINAVAAIQTSLTAHALLAALQNIEHEHGRLRPYRNAPRTLDLDLLLYGSSAIHDANLTVPHPRMHQRAFVLKPLSELAAGLSLPQGSLKDLLAACADQAIERLPD